MMNDSMVDHHPSIDWQLSIKLANNNKELAKDLLGMFMADLPKANESIQAASAQRKMIELGNQVHKLHGASCYCGVTRLKTLLSKMEFALREKSLSQFDALLVQFDEEVNNILSAYKMINFE